MFQSCMFVCAYTVGKIGSKKSGVGLDEPKDSMPEVVQVVTWESGWDLETHTHKTHTHLSIYLPVHPSPLKHTL